MKNITLIVLFLSLSVCMIAQVNPPVTTPKVRTTGLTVQEALQIPATVLSINLDLTKEELKTLPDEITKMEKMRGFTINRAPKVTSFDFADALQKLSKLASLQRLAIESTQGNFIEIPSNIGLFKHLDDLTLSNNGHKEIPTEIGNLTSLTAVDFSDNSLTKLPESFGNLKLLEALSLDGNEFTEDIMPIIVKLKELTDLDLSANKISSIPAEIGSLDALEDLDLSENPITSLPPEIKNLKKLESLYLYQTKISDQDIEKLKKLLPDCDVSNQEATCFPAQTLIEMTDGSRICIENICIGDQIKSFNTVSKKMESSVVRMVKLHHAKKYFIYNIDFQIISSTASILEPGTPKNALFSLTGNHPVYVKDSGWKKASELVDGDILLYLSADNSGLQEAFVTGVHQQEKTVPAVYNLRTNKGNYFAGGILVRNK